jgi:hypothetical protein
VPTYLIFFCVFKLGIYYWNAITGETTWEKPTTFGQSKATDEEFQTGSFIFLIVLFPVLLFIFIIVIIYVRLLFYLRLVLFYFRLDYFHVDLLLFYFI